MSGRKRPGGALYFATVAAMIITILAVCALIVILALKIKSGESIIPEPADTSTDSARPSDNDTSNLPETTGTGDSPSTQTPPESTSAESTTASPVTTSAPVTTQAPVTTKTPDTTAAQPAPIWPPAPEGVLVPGSDDGGQEYIDLIVFMGDSTTYGMKVYTDLKSTQVWTPLSGTLDLYEIAQKKICPDYNTETEISIAEALSSKKPEILIVTLGTNFSPYSSASWSMDQKKEYFKIQIGNIIKMVKDNSPGTVLVFQTIYPTIDSLVTYNQLNESINTRNTWLLEACSEKGVRVLNTREALCDETGQLKKEYNTYHGDGIHLNPAGFAAVLEYVRTHKVK